MGAAAAVAAVLSVCPEMTEVSPEQVEAGDPTTPPLRLVELAHHHEERVRSAVASNPAAPSLVLQRLARRHWECVANNPALPLLLLSEPGWFGQLDEPTLEVILCAPATPPAWWPLFATHPVSVFIAIEKKRVDILRVLLDAGADPHATRDLYVDGDVHTFSTLEVATAWNLPEALPLLLAAGASPS